MERSIKRQQLIISIQEYAKKEKLNTTDMLYLVNERGGDISETTMRRILKADAEKESFSFDTLRRISAALFEVNACPIPAEDMKTAQEAELEALRAMSALTATELKDAQAKIALLEHELAEAKLKITELTEIADFRRRQMEEKDSEIHKLWGLVGNK